MNVKINSSLLPRAALAVWMLTVLFGAATPAGEMEGMPNLQALFGGGNTQQASRNQLDAESLRTLLSKERNVIIEEQGGMLIVDGRVSSQSAQRRLSKILEKYDNILDLTEFIQDEEAILARADYLKQKIEERLNRGYDPARAFVPQQTVEYEIVENEVVIVGELNNSTDVQQVASIVDTYEKSDGTGGGGGSQQQDGDINPSARHISVRKQPLEVDVIFARLNSNDQKIVGVNGLISGVVSIPELTYAAPATGAQGIGGIDMGTPDGVKGLRRVFNGHTWSAGEGTLSMAPLTLSLTDLESSDSILSRPHLSALNGTSARFHAGGQLGIRMVGSDSSSVEWKDYGTVLTATPTLTSDGRVHMKLSLEISSITSAPSGGDVGLSRFEHESEAIIAANQGMILSGIVRDLRGRGANGIPGLRKIPIIGYFFGERNRTGESEELVIIAIPRFPEVINNHPVTNTASTSRLINGVIHEVIRRGDAKSGSLFDCDPVTGAPLATPEVRVDVLPPQVTINETVVNSPSLPPNYVPSYAPQSVDLMGDLVNVYGTGSTASGNVLYAP